MKSPMVRITLLIVIALAWVLPAAAIAKTMHFLSVWPVNQDNTRIIMELTAQYRKLNPDFSLEVEYVEAGKLQQRIKVLLASGDLPDIFAYSAGTPMEELIDSGKVLDVEKTFRDLGLYDVIDPGAAALLKRLSGNKGLFDLPLGYNIEGIWYNKALFAKAGLGVPVTWEDLESACTSLQARGIQPFTTGGKDRWPLSRLVNMYILRKAGIHAMEAAVAGKIAFDNPDFIEAATRIQSWAQKGWFGSGYLAINQTGAEDLFFAGKAAMIYNGSWFTAGLNDPKRNLLGPDGVGFFNIPLVKGGKGTATEYSMNCGNILCLSKDKFDAASADWLRFVFTRIGDYSMQEFGVLKGYRTTRPPLNASVYTILVQKELAKASNAGLWFEAHFDVKTAQVALDNMQGLFLGAVSPAELFSKIEKSNKAGRQQGK